jgi:hypothetical protein
MAWSTTRTPRLRDILLAVVALVALIVAFINLGAVVKFVGAGLLLIPSGLGIVQRVGVEDISTYDLSSSPTLLGISQPGRYAVYAYDYDLLTMSDQLEEAKAEPWITMKSQITGEAVPVTFVERGMRMYDTPLAKGRPVLSFVIDKPGVYVMLHPSKQATISIVRDYVTGKEGILTLIYLVEIGLLLMPLMLILLRRYTARREARKRAQEAARERGEAFWRSRSTRR